LGLPITTTRVPGIADAGEIVQALQDVARAVGFDHDHVRRRHRFIDFDRRGEAAFLGGDMRLGEPAILPGRRHCGERLVGLAKACTEMRGTGAICSSGCRG
jgi:hypothetical protein